MSNIHHINYDRENEQARRPQQPNPN
jgi:membrane associated rhomboid family serine protease